MNDLENREEIERRYVYMKKIEKGPAARSARTIPYQEHLDENEISGRKYVNSTSNWFKVRD